MSRPGIALRRALTLPQSFPPAVAPVLALLLGALARGCA